MQHSVIRRSLIITTVFVTGHLFQYALMIVANRLLDPGSFGRYYVALSLLNVLLTPVTVLTFSFTQHFSTVFAATGISPVASELKILQRRHALVGSGLVLLCVFSLLLVGSLIGADSFMLLVLVPALALGIYLFEMARAAFQGALDFVTYSAAWIGWWAGQFAVATLALYLIGTPWAGIAAMLLVTVISTFVLLSIMLRSSSDRVDIVKGTWPPFRVRTALPFAVEYGLFIFVTNIDVLIAYVTLDNYALGVYAASTVLPKALVTATYPVSQVMLPVMSAFGSDHRARHLALLKALFVCALFGAAGALILSAGSGLACNERFGFRFCSPWILTVLSLSAISLGLTRVLVVAGLALGNQRYLVVPALMLGLFAAAAIVWGHKPENLAVIYTLFCWLLLAVYSYVTLNNGQRQGQSAQHTPFTSQPENHWG
jgi:O-antigen/teichoic acid export membrane protein